MLEIVRWMILRDDVIAEKLALPCVSGHIKYCAVIYRWPYELLCCDLLVAI
jgi:hypothetical protein